MPEEQQCPCRSERLYEECCGLLHSGKQRARTAEQLMRSRYSAYSLGEIDYLVETLHPPQRENDLRQSLQTSIARVKWKHLQILRTSAGGAEDKKGEVDFVAVFEDQGDATHKPEVGRLYERSSFVHEGGRWYYVNGIFEGLPPLPKLGRNDPCWCGSGKKLKKCHPA